MRLPQGVLSVVAVAILTVASAAGDGARAHPHVWIEAQSDVVFDADGRIAAINVEWEFDEFFSLTAVEGYDADGDGTYTPDELQPLAAENIAALAEYRYFTYVKAGDAPVDYATVSEYGAFFRDGRLSMYFSVPFAEPVDPLASAVSYTIHDPTFFIAIEPRREDPVTIVGDPPAPCRIELAAPADEGGDQPYSESFFEQLADTDDIGSLYATRIAVVCTPETARK